MIDRALRHLPIGAKLLLPPIVGLAMMGLLAAGGWSLISHQRVALVQRVDRAIAMDRAIAEIPASLAHIQRSLYKLSAWSAIGVRGEEMTRTRAQLDNELLVLLDEVSRLVLGDDEVAVRFRDQLT